MKIYIMVFIMTSLTFSLWSDTTGINRVFTESRNAFGTTGTLMWTSHLNTSGGGYRTFGTKHPLKGLLNADVIRGYRVYNWDFKYYKKEDLYYIDISTSNNTQTIFSENRWDWYLTYNGKIYYVNWRATHWINKRIGKIMLDEHFKETQ